MIRFQQIRNLLREFQFQNVFRELGWGNPPRIPSPEFQVEGARYRFTPIAEQGGLHAFEVTNLTDGLIPTRATQLALKQQLTPLFAEHFLVFVNSARTTSLWLWMWRDGDTRKPVDQRFDRIQSGELLLQKLSGLHFDFDDLDDDGKATIGQVLDRLNANFYAEKVTKRFYEDFRKYKDKFITFIQGIDSVENRQWYASVILNRLMFIYFLQQKRFLSGDAQYLQNKFKHCEENGLNYYRDFLCPLFFKGFALRAEERDAATNMLLGTVPYLNGGLFLEHPHLEADGKLQSIRIENAAFKRLLAFFGEYNWHLDERPMRNDREINPDVLGYIFEKYVNQKQMGAYYTKEDITEYISKSTIVPFIFDAVARKCPAAFNGDGAVWKLLQLDPDRYIYDAVKKGEEQPLPADIEAGGNDVTKRTCWNKPAREEFALPTEIWREVVARRQRCAEVRAKLAAGEVKHINTLVTLNLNLREFLEDVINDCRDPELLAAIYYTVAGRVPDPEKQANQEIQPGLSVLDPTCGSGAFLFAALNILEPIYEACLSKMQEFLASVNNGKARRFSHFQRILDEVAPHQNARYFILKSIVINNLYGVDIMEEAVEICKLRLFLKLVAQVDADPAKDNLGIEPLPDIDFNVRAGNTLVGYATRAEVEKSAESDMLRKKALPQILEDADIADRAFKRFRQLQTSVATSVQEMAQAKRELQRRLVALEKQLNCFLAEDYQLGLSQKKEAFETWLRRHQPFHWLVEFYGIVSNGGFDVIIGNPPYVNFRKIEYKIPSNYTCFECGDLFAVCTERSYAIGRTQARVGLIIPLSATSTDTMTALKRCINTSSASAWTSYFSASDQPASLFTGVRHRLMVLLSERGDRGQCKLQTTRFLKWFNPEREALFSSFITYAASSGHSFDPFCKVSSATEISILEKAFAKKSLAHEATKSGFPIYYHNAPVHWGKVFDFVPHFRVGAANPQQSSHLKSLSFQDGNGAKVALCLLNSSFFYWFNWQYSNCRDLSSKDILRAPLEIKSMNPGNVKQLADLAGELMADLKKHKSLYSRVVDGVTTEFDSFYPAKSKAILDEIDTVLARHYGFTAEELDFILNYDIKYRLGRDTESEDE